MAADEERGAKKFRGDSLRKEKGSDSHRGFEIGVVGKDISYWDIVVLKSRLNNNSSKDKEDTSYNGCMRREGAYYTARPAKTQQGSLR